MSALVLALVLAAVAPASAPDLSGLEPTVAAQIAEMRTLGTPGDLGQVYLAYGFNDAAADRFNAAAALEPGDPRWPYLLGAAHQAAGRLDDAAAAFTHALEKAPNAAAGWVHLGEIRLLQGRLDDAEAALRKALAVPATSAAAHSLLGQAALARRDFKAVVEHLEAALAAVPEANRLHYPLALAYRGLNNRARAEEHLARAGQVGLKPPDPLLDGVANLRLGERVALMRGRVAAQAGRYADAAQEFRKALAARPESVEARVNLGSVLASAGDRAGAVEQLLDALRLDPSNVTAHFNLGSLLPAAEARPHLEAAVAARPEDAEARRLLAQALRDGGHLPEALEQYGEAVTLAPGDEAACLGEAETLVRLGRYAEARKRLEDDLARMPTSGLLSHALARLLAACPERPVRDGARALPLAQAVWQAQPTADHGRTVALALAELGRCREAADWQHAALEQAHRQGETGERLGGLERELAIYERGAPCRP
jgi:tetratricopeptide (TPR) repeat protein